MKRLLPVIIVVVLIVGGAAAYFLLKPDSAVSEGSYTSPNAVAKRFDPPEACKLFTLDDAKKVLGDTTESSETTPPSASTDDIEVSQCLYTQPSGDTLASIKSAKQASILVRGAKTQAGIDSNDAMFNGAKRPREAVAVEGYGDAAYWNPQFGQFNIYKHGNWYILSVGTSTPSERSLDEAKKLADELIDKL